MLAEQIHNSRLKHDHSYVYVCINYVGTIQKKMVAHKYTTEHIFSKKFTSSVLYINVHMYVCMSNFTHSTVIAPTSVIHYMCMHTTLVNTLGNVHTYLCPYLIKYLTVDCVPHTCIRRYWGNSQAMMSL